jgi:hypothetical protein
LPGFLKTTVEDCLKWRGWYENCRQASNKGWRNSRRGFPRSLRKNIGSPSGPGALWECALERAEAISQGRWRRMRIFQQGIETQGYQRDQQRKQAERSVL